MSKTSFISRIDDRKSFILIFVKRENEIRDWIGGFLTTLTYGSYDSQ